MVTYETVRSTYERLYQELRELNGENAPSSYTWFAPTLDELHADCSLAADEDRGDRRDVGGGDPVAYVYECNGPTHATIGGEATEAEVEDLLREFMALTGDDE